MTKPSASITVDRSFVRIGGRSFAIHQISAVEVREQPGAKGGRAALPLFIVGAVVLLISFALPSYGMIVGSVAGGISILGAAISAGGADKPPTWELLITTSSGQAQALVSRHEREVRELQAAIEIAIDGGAPA